MGSPAGDHFPTFLALGPARDMRRTPSCTSLPQTEQMLREEVARAKRQLLEVTLQTESRALDPATKEEDVAQSLERLRRAADCLNSTDTMGGIEDGAQGYANRGKKPPPASIDTSAMMADTRAPLS